MTFGNIAQVSIAQMLCVVFTAGAGNRYALPFCRTGDGT